MKLCFDSIAEVREFVAGLKGTRGKKGEGDDDNAAGATGQAPTPLQPPANQQPGGTAFAPAAFVPPQQQQPGGFPGATGGDPAVNALVQRVNARIDGAIASGQPVDAMLGWFRGQCGAEAANATMDQIKQVFLPKLTVPALEQIAKLMNA